MTIKEVEQYLEVPRATVRFYEKEGLISPERGGNGYRATAKRMWKGCVRLLSFVSWVWH